jgi:hypothetical protein
MCSPQDETEVREEVAWEESDDVQSEVPEIIGAKTRFFVTKCRFTRSTATLAFLSRFARTVLTLPESSMSRRQISFVVVAIASLVVSACGTSPTAPSHDEPVIVVVGTGG